MGDIITIIKSLEHLGTLIDGFSETVKMKLKNQEGGFLGMLLGTLVASMSGNMLTRKKGVLRAIRRYNNINESF